MHSLSEISRLRRNRNVKIAVRTQLKILIVKLTAIGDVVHGLPLVSAIKAQAPHFEVDWVVDRKALDVLKNNPNINNVYVFESKKWFKSGNILSHLPEVQEFFGSIRRQRYDIVIDIQGLLKSSAVAFLSGAQRRIGFHRNDCREKASSFLIQEHSKTSYKDAHVVLRNLSPLARVFPGFKPSLDYDYTLYLNDEEKQKAQSTLSGLNLKKKEYLLVNPGGGWKTKLWFPERYAEVCRHLQEKHNLTALLLWGPGEEPLVEKIKQGCESAVIAPRTTLRDMSALIEHGRFMLSPETGPLHIADSLGLASVVLYGPSNIEINHPVKSPSYSVMPEIDCGGCYIRNCPNPICLEKITSEMVIEQVEALLKDETVYSFS